MSKFSDKVNGDSVEDSEYNNIVRGIKNSIKDSGQTIDLTNIQLSKALAEYAGKSTFYTENGVANVYNLIPQAAFKGLVSLTNGAEVRFRAANPNTGASTINANGTGVRSIKLSDGISNPVEGDITTTADTRIRFDLANNTWILEDKLVIPAGMISPFAFETPPSGWLECDGAAISRTTFITLFTAIGLRFGIGDGSTTFNIPDLRGEFIRGWANGSTTDPDRASRSNSGDGTTGDNVGTKQDDAGREITGTFRGFRISNLTGAFSLDSTIGGQLACAGGTSQQNTDFNASNSWTAAHTGADFRPTNISMMYCIKF